MAILTKRETWRAPKQLGPAKYTPDLSAEEHENVRRALHVLRRRFGSWAALAEAMGTKMKTVEHAGGRHHKPSVAIALRVARLAGVPLEDVLSGAWPKPGACPMCGRT